MAEANSTVGAFEGAVVHFRGHKRISDRIALPGVIGIQQQGRIAIATASAFEPDLPNAYERTGARVQRVENMTLEEIFVAKVEHSREEVNA